MTDEEVIKALEETYVKRLFEAIENWSNYDFINAAVVSGISKLYIPREYDLVTYFETDDTGNQVIREIIGFPKSGIADNATVIYYPDSTEYDYLNYFKGGLNSGFGTTIEYQGEYQETGLTEAYFSTGYGLKSDFKQVADWFCFSNGCTTTGTVYNSNYFGFQSMSTAWTENSSLLVFRDDNAYDLTVSIDSFDSPYADTISFIDPSSDDIQSL